MGALYEFNWYLVVADKLEVEKLENDKYIIIKSENRIYPINCEIPIIIKKEGCIGIVKILSFTIEEGQTIIKFEYINKLSITDPISKHYYDMYLLMKNR